MPLTSKSSHGVGFDTVIPAPFGVPDVPQQFHYEAEGTNAGYLVWERDDGAIMTDGFYQLERSTAYNGTYTQVGANIANPSSGKWVSQFDASASKGNWWRLRARTVKGEVSEYTKPQKFPLTDDVCLVKLGLQDFALKTFQQATLTAYADTTEDYVVYDGYSIIPAPKVSVELDVEAQAFYMRLIPSADIGDVKYIFKLITPDKVITFAAVTVPTLDETYFTSLLA